MKIGYEILKIWVRLGLFFYYGKIEVIGRENIPKDKPIMLLANHQNALMDALLIVMKFDRKPYFLARADLFKRPWASRFLHYLQMIPIYRFRDGMRTLKKNPAIFEKCGELLGKGETVMLFPEGNHGIQKRVRWPMRKGFVKMIFEALDQKPDLDIQIVPLGLNYRQAEGFPDSVSLYIGKSLAVKDYYDPHDLEATANQLKQLVFDKLTQLTTHIPNEETYSNVLTQLQKRGVDFLRPEQVNGIIGSIDEDLVIPEPNKEKSIVGKVVGILFKMLNFPMLLLWNKALKPLVEDIEFWATLRFGLGLLVFPFYYLLLFLLVYGTMGQEVAIAFSLTHILFNLVYVKQNGFTS